MKGRVQADHEVQLLRAPLLVIRRRRSVAKCR